MSVSASEFKRIERELIRLGLERTVESLRSEAQSRQTAGADSLPAMSPTTDTFFLSSPRPLETSASDTLAPLAIAQPVVSEIPQGISLSKRNSDITHIKSRSRAKKTQPRFIICPVRDQTEFKLTEIPHKESSTYGEEYPVTPVCFSACSSASKSSHNFLDPPTSTSTHTMPDNPFTWDKQEPKTPEIDLAPIPVQPAQLIMTGAHQIVPEPASPVHMTRSESISRVDSLNRSQEMADTIDKLQIEDAMDPSEEPEDNATIVSLPESDASPFTGEFEFDSHEPQEDIFPSLAEEPKQFSFRPTPQGQDAGTRGLNDFLSFKSSRSSDMPSTGTNSVQTTKSPLGLVLSSTSLSSALDVSYSSLDLSSPNESDVPPPSTAPPLLLHPRNFQKRVSLSLNSDWDSILRDIETSKAHGNSHLGTFPEELWVNKRNSNSNTKDNKRVEYQVPRYEFSQSYIDGTYDVIDLRIFHKRGKTGFESNKDLYVEMGDIIAGRYQVIKVVGSAVFSKAIKAVDLKLNTTVCLKMVKNVKDYFDQSLDEIKLLRYLNKMDPDDDQGVVRLLDFFYYREHLFLVFELLRQNLYEMQQTSIAEYKTVTSPGYYFSPIRMQSIAKQILTTLAFLHSKNIIHSDLKPENVLIKDEQTGLIKVIDLGSSCFVTDYLGSYVQSRSYRAPEVVLGVDYDQRIDLWSLGCMMVELVTDFVLFQSICLTELLAKIESVCGPLPQWMIIGGKFSGKYYTASSKLYRKNAATRDFETLSSVPCPLSEILKDSDEGFVSFVSMLLTPDPTKRPRAIEMLKHSWLQ